MCAPIPLGIHLRFNRLHNNPHSRVLSARRALFIESRQTITSQQNTDPLQASLILTNLPVTTPPSTALSPSGSISVPGLSSNQGIQTLSVAPPSPSTVIISSSVATLTASFTPNLASSKTTTSTVVLSSGSAVISSTESMSTWTATSTYDTTSSLISTTTITPVTSTITPVISQSSDPTLTMTTSYTSIQSTNTGNSLSDPFTSVSSSTMSTITDPSSSIAATSSTTNGTVPAVATVVASPISVSPASLSAHNPPFYIGTVLGAIAGIACLCALIAWFIRLRSHMRRRRAWGSLKLPWTKSDDGDTWGLESGHGHSGSDVDIVAISAMNLGSREDLAHVQAWSPRGDRDVGEPRRTESYINGSTYSLQNHPIPEHCLFSDDSVREFASSEGYSTASLLPHHNLRHLPSHLIDQELAARVSRERGSSDNIYRMDFVNSNNNIDCGTQRERMNNPRFLSLRGDSLNVPWNVNSHHSPRSMVQRLRNHGKPLPTEPPWQQISSLRGSGETGEKEGKNVVEAEPWSASFRTSLVSAFNAVAANLSSASGVPHMTHDGFTPVPPKRTARTSVRGTFWEDNMTKADKELSRETSVSTVTSKTWTLEETREGAGVVRLFIPGLQGCGDDNGGGIQRPHLSGPTLSFGDGNDVISDDGSGWRQCMEVEHSQIPLIASEKPPPPAVMRPNSYHTRRNTKKTAISSSSLSRMESIYSTASSGKVPPIGGIVPSKRSDNPYYDDSSESIVIQPSRISRLSTSSSASSTSRKP